MGDERVRWGINGVKKGEERVREETNGWEVNGRYVGYEWDWEDIGVDEWTLRVEELRMGDGKQRGMGDMKQTDQKWEVHRW